MNEEEIIAVVEAELSRRGIPHSDRISVEIKDESFSPTTAPKETILGKIKIGLREFYATMKTIVSSRSVKVTLWIVFAGIPTFGFYFPSQYDQAKELAINSTMIIQQEYLELRDQDEGKYVIINPEWRESEEAYNADHIRYLANLPTGSYNMPLSAYPDSVHDTDFTLSGSYHG